MSAALIRWAVAGFIAGAVSATPYLMGDIPTEDEAAADVAADKHDAEQQAGELRAELARHQAANPHLWTPDTIARADAAVGIALQQRTDGGVR